MAIFTVDGPFQVPTYQGKAAKIVDSEQLPEFWKSIGAVAKARGCYLFAIRASKGIRPVYVGKAAKTFQQEVFTPHKLEKYQRCLADFVKGTPVLFFLRLPQTTGKPNVKAIEELEDYLIQTAVSKNPELLNVRGTERENWGIAGVLRGGSGKPSHAAKKFKTAIGL